MMRRRDKIDKPIIKEFEGSEIATLVWNDRVCWIAKARCN
jgi:hypothetical protein